MVERVRGLAHRWPKRESVWLCRLLDRAGERLEWGLYATSGERRGELYEGRIEQLLAAVAADHHPLRLIVPGRCVRSESLDLPPMRLKKRRQAIAFTLEDSLLAELERVHIADGLGASDACVPCWVVDDQLMQQWKALFAPVADRIDAMVPEYAALNTGDGAVLIQGELGQWWLVCDQWQGVVLEDSLLAIALERSRAAGTSMRLLWRTSIPEVLSNNHAWPLVSVAHDGGAVLDACHALARQRPRLNLLQGAYASLLPRAGRAIGHFWLVAGVLMLMLALLPAGVGFHYRQQAEELSQQAERRYKGWFPNDHRIVNIPAQVKNHLQQPAPAGEQRELLPLLVSLNSVVGSLGLAEHYPVTSLDFQADAGVLRAEISLDGMHQVDQARAGIKGQGQNGGVESASAEQDGRVRAVLLLGGASVK